MQGSITNKESFRGWILTELGEEYQCIDVTEKQMDQIIEKTIQKYSRFAYDGLKERIYILPIVQDQQEYVIGDDASEPNIYSIIGVIEESRINSLLLTHRLGDETMVINLFGNTSNWYKFLDYEIMGGYLELYHKIYMKKTSYKWNEPEQTLYLNAPPAGDDRLALIVNQYHDKENNLYNINWVRQYATELTRLQWGRNLMKMNNVTLPGGASVNFEGIISEAKEEIEKLDTELMETWAEPPSFYVG